MKDLNKRKSTRFRSEPGTLARLEFSRGKGKKLSYVALVLTESHNGCSCVVVRAHDLVVGDFCSVKISAMAPIDAQVRWVVPLEEEIQKVGFQFME